MLVQLLLSGLEKNKIEIKVELGELPGEIVTERKMKIQIIILE